MLASVTSPERKVSYGYDGYGQLISRTEDGGGQLQNVYDGQQLLLQRRSGAGSDPSVTDYEVTMITEGREDTSACR